MEEARALLESAERGKRQVGAGQIVLFDISGHDHLCQLIFVDTITFVLFDLSRHDHLGGCGACRVQGGRQPDEHHQLKGENQCFYASDIRNISHFLFDLFY